MAFVVEEDVTADPGNVGFSGAVAQMTEGARLADLVQEAGRRGCGRRDVVWDGGRRSGRRRELNAASLAALSGRRSGADRPQSGWEPGGSRRPAEPPIQASGATGAAELWVRIVG
jgi:hypothetical protein